MQDSFHTFLEVFLFSNKVSIQGSPFTSPMSMSIFNQEQYIILLSLIPYRRCSEIPGRTLRWLINFVSFFQVRSPKSPDISGVARRGGGGGGKGEKCPLDSEKFVKNREKRGKIGKLLSLCPSWQIYGLATLLPDIRSYLCNYASIIIHIA